MAPDEVIVSGEVTSTPNVTPLRYPLIVDDIKPPPISGISVDPPAGQIGESGKVLGQGQPRGLEAAHLAGRSSRPKIAF